MAKRIPNNLRSHMKVGRGLYLKILKGLKYKKFIHKFESCHSLSENIFSFKIYITLTQYLVINFFSSRFPEGLYLGDEHYDNLSVSVGKETEPHKIESFLKRHIHQRVYGHKVENYVTINVKKAIDLGNGNIIDIQNPVDRQEDINGVDRWVVYKSKTSPFEKIKYPLQIKTSLPGQSKHQKSFPRIPSIACLPDYHNRRYFDWKKLESLLEEIGEAYKNKKILHLSIRKEN